MPFGYEFFWNIEWVRTTLQIDFGDIKKLPKIHKIHRDSYHEPVWGTLSCKTLFAFRTAEKMSPEIQDSCRVSHQTLLNHGDFSQKYEDSMRLWRSRTILNNFFCCMKLNKMFLEEISLSRHMIRTFWKFRRLFFRSWVNFAHLDSLGCK